VTDNDQLAHLRHELLNPINQILGLTEIQMEEAADHGFLDCVPALTEINTGGRALHAIIQDEFAPAFRSSSLDHFAARIESQAEPTIGQAKELAHRLRSAGQNSAAEDMDLVSAALESLLALCRQTKPT